jgi:PST family polysaccharide transporter
VQQALLRKSMAFRRLALLNALAVVFGGSAAIAIVLNGGGVWSLVAQQLLTATTSTVLFWISSSWRPRFRCRPREAARLLRFSGAVLTLQFGVYASNQSDTLLLGLFFGPIAVGVYRVADRLMRMLLEVATRSVQMVALPHFSRLQDDPEALRAAVRSCIRLSATITIPAMAILATVGEPLFAVMGEQWSASSSVLKVVVIMGMAKAVTLFTGPLLLAKGRPMVPAMLTWILGALTVGGIAVVGILAEQSTVDVQVVAAALARTSIFVLVYGITSLALTRRECGLSIRRCIVQIAPGATAGAAVLLTGMFTGRVLAPATSSPVIELLIQIGTATIVGMTVLAILERSVRAFVAERIGRLVRRKDGRVGTFRWPALPGAHD